MLPRFLKDAIAQQFETPIDRVLNTGDGGINQTVTVCLRNGQTLFIKWHRQAAAGMFLAEAQGLERLSAAQALRVPKPYHANEHYIIMEWLGSGRRAARESAIALGRGLAQQHRVTAPHYGLDHNNYCGLTPQNNKPASDWVTFFGTRRLDAQMNLAAQRGRLLPERRQKLEALIGKLSNLLPATPPASLLHGDLWGGNWLVADDGQPALIDPAIYFGDREADLAFTELFGGFPPEFYHAYQEAWPLLSGYDERKAIYNLYHLLNHLNLFGESYGGSVDSILNRYL